VSHVVRTALVRWALLLLFWVALIGFSLSALVVGVVAAGGATWVSLRLLPPAPQRVRLGALALLLPRFLWQSLLAGWDVARRAFDPRLPLRPGFVAYRPGHAPGHLRNTFATISSLMPGTLPCDENEDEIIFHCLDVGQPVLEQLAAEEKALARVLEEVPGDG
jgi:multicomponent Na+:H+ antiporter subunit E